MKSRSGGSEKSARKFSGKQRERESDPLEPQIGNKQLRGMGRFRAIISGMFARPKTLNFFEP